MDALRRRLGFDFAEYVDLVNTGGGLALWWKEGVSFEYLLKEKNLIHVRIQQGLGQVTEQERRQWWQRVQLLNPGPDIPWLCFGDFNDIVASSEKDGGRFRAEAKVGIERVRRQTERCPDISIQND